MNIEKLSYRPDLDISDNPQDLNINRIPSMSFPFFPQGINVNFLQATSCLPVFISTDKELTHIYYSFR
ncbi:MAG: hypothetical protein LBH60_02845 [Prevotellaceae bacterium]|nr:hypothetical protein [Prevotellaceae bacterium]